MPGPLGGRRSLGIVSAVLCILIMAVSSASSVLSHDTNTPVDLNIVLSYSLHGSYLKFTLSIIATNIRNHTILVKLYDPIVEILSYNNTEIYKSKFSLPDYFLVDNDNYVILNLSISINIGNNDVRYIVVYSGRFIVENKLGNYTIETVKILDLGKGLKAEKIYNRYIQGGINAVVRYISEKQEKEENGTPVIVPVNKTKIIEFPSSKKEPSANNMLFQRSYIIDLLLVFLGLIYSYFIFMGGKLLLEK